MDELQRFVVVALVFICKGSELLLVKQNYGQKYWALPGGVVEAGESVPQAAIREVKEETGLEIHLKHLIALYSMPGEDSLAITFEGEIVSGRLAPGFEISECRYFPFDQLPETRHHFRQRFDDFRGNFSHALFRTQ